MSHELVCVGSSIRKERVMGFPSIMSSMTEDDNVPNLLKTYKQYSFERRQVRSGCFMIYMNFLKISVTNFTLSPEVCLELVVSFLTPREYRK